MTLLVAVLDVPAAGAGALRAYEDRVLPLLARHGGALERRLRSPDGRTEVHVVRFATAAGREAFGADPERAAARALLDGSRSSPGWLRSRTCLSRRAPPGSAA